MINDFEKSKEKSQDSQNLLKQVGIPAAAGLSVLLGGRFVAPRIARHMYNKKIEKAMKDISPEKWKEERISGLTKKRYDLISKRMASSDMNEKEELAKAIGRIEDEIEELNNLKGDALKSKIREHVEDDFIDNAAKKYNTMNSTAKGLALLATGLTYKNLNKDNKKNDKTNFAETTAYNLAGHLGSAYIPGVSNIAGYLYGLQKGHPVEGLIGGVSAVNGAISKDKGEGSFGSTVASGAIAGGILGAVKPDFIKDKASGLIGRVYHIANKVKSLKDGERVFSELPTKGFEEAISDIRSFKRGGTAALGALGLGVASAGAYGLGKLFGVKNKQNKE